MKRTTKVVTSFDVNDDFYVEVIPYKHDNEDWLEFTLCKNNYAIKQFMFGLLANECPEEEWEELIEANVEDYIEVFIHDMDIFDAVDEMEIEEECECECDCCCGCCDCEEELYIYEAIDAHNEHVEKMSDLAECLMDVYPDREETAVNDAFCKAYNGLIVNAIWLCCEANGLDNGKWMTTEDWHVVKEEVEG